MEYIQNGDFAKGFESWTKKDPVTLIRDPHGDHALFRAGGKLLQTWRAFGGVEKLTLALDIQVEEGSGEAEGDVQVLFSYQTGAGNPVYRTFNIKEPADWERVELTLNLPSRPDSGQLDLLVQTRFARAVSMKAISLRDDVKGGKSGGFEEVKK